MALTEEIKIKSTHVEGNFFWKFTGKTNDSET